MMRSLILALALIPALAQAQYRCEMNGRSVVQSEPCTAPVKSGKYRCFVDGEVVYSEASCTTIKSRDTLAKEAKAASDADNAKRQAEAAVKEAGDRPNFTRRISYAQRATALHLRDPDSARFASSRVSWFSGTPAVCGLISGRNGFGGYGNHVRFVTIDDWVEIDDGKIYKEFDKHWNQYCGPSA